MSSPRHPQGRTDRPQSAAADPALTTAQRRELQRVLERCRRQRTSQLASLAARDEPSDLVTRAHITSVRETLSAIEAALARLADGRFGRCRSCAGGIPWERLQLVPYTDECVSCRQQRAARR